MYRSIKNDVILILKRPGAMISWLAVCFLAVVNFIRNINIAAGQHYITQMYDVAYINTLSSWSWGGFFLMMIYPVLVVLPTATCIMNDRNSRINTYIVTRMSLKKYYTSKLLAAFCSTFIIFTVPLFMELVTMYICLPVSAHGQPSNFAIFSTATEIYDYPLSGLYIHNHFLWQLFTIVVFGIISGILSVFNVAVVSVGKIKYGIFTMIWVYILLNIFAVAGDMLNVKFTMDYFKILLIFNSEKNYVVYGAFLVVLIMISMGIITYKVKKEDIM